MLEWVSDKFYDLFGDSGLLMLEMNILALGVHTMPADALAPKVARASAGIVLATCKTNSMYCSSRVSYIYLGQAKSQHTILNVNKRIQGVPLHNACLCIAQDIGNYHDDIGRSMYTRGAPSNVGLYH